MDRLARQVKIALEAADLSAYSDLLDPDVHWGPPDNPTVCKNRRQVLTWYERGRDGGTRARVSEVTVLGDRILVGLQVTGSRGAAASKGEMERWQVLTVRDGRIVEIVGFDERRSAVARVGAPSAPEQTATLDGD
jgi:ketosteroid isomerase-like protein